MADIFGWIGTTLVLFSFTLNNIVKLRVVNAIGSIAWIVYGIIGFIAVAAVFGTIDMLKQISKIKDDE